MKKSYILLVTIFLVASACSLLSEDNNKENIKLGEGVTDIDGNVYGTVLIGNQEWMSENLKVTRMSDGRELVKDNTLNSTAASDTTAYAVYQVNISDVANNDSLVSSHYGFLYNYHVATDEVGICPEGWRVPSREDWVVLTDYLKDRGQKNEVVNSSGAGNALKSNQVLSREQSATEWTSSDIPGWFTDETHTGRNLYGFNGLPGGMYRSSGSEGLGMYGAWWDSSPIAGGVAVYRTLNYNSGSLTTSGTSASSGASIRCMR
ncbi:MAG: fibrobacter succinogenes major paralogous domain-containing protein [Balneolales bacterium]|nr:fibrobacter succinogenes major paralogous domain-containing protein [Balneolales bacterium]